MEKGSLARWWAGSSAALLGGWLALTVLLPGIPGCGEDERCDIATGGPFGSLSAADVQTFVARAASFAASRSVAATIAVSDRPGNPLAIFQMSGGGGSVSETYRKARTAAFFSTNGNAFSTRTAAFIIQDFYPPGIPNTPAGPLFGVQFSQLPCSDIQRNGAAVVAPSGDDPEAGQGLAGLPGSVPIYAAGTVAAGGLSVHGSGDPILDEQIALAGVTGFEAPEDIRATSIFLDGFRLPFLESSPPAPVEVRPVAGTFLAGPIGTVQTGFPRRDLGGLVVDQPIPTSAGRFLTAAEVDRILRNGALRGEGTRAAIRKCGPMKMNVSVVDVDGRPLGTIRTLDAPIFGFDVSVQKARTSAAFSDPNQGLGQEIRSILGLPQGSGLAVSTRAVGFLSQISYPPAVTGNPPGPLRGRQQQLSATCAPSGNGITIFPGGLPLYRGDQLVGAIGISGDGVDQDEIVAAAGTVGFEAPDAIRTDAVFFGGTRLPYFKEPRNPGRGVE